jgi:hypothetical protein
MPALNKPSPGLRGKTSAGFPVTVVEVNRAPVTGVRSVRRKLGGGAEPNPSGPARILLAVIAHDPDGRVALPAKNHPAKEPGWVYTIRPDAEREVAMNRPGISWAMALIVVGAVLATSCSKGTSSAPAQQAGTSGQPPVASSPAQPAAQPAGAPAQAAPAAAPAGVIATGEYSADPDLRCDLMEVKRVSGGAVLVKWRVVNAAQAAGGLTASAPKKINYDGHWGDLYYIDPAENKKYSYLTDAGGQGIVDVYWGDIAAGQQRGYWAKFPAPPPTSTKIAVHIPSFPPFEDVPLAQ